MTTVRRHARQLASGKTTTVRQHERAVQHQGRDTADDWWDYRDQAQPEGDYPEGTTFFDQDGETYAVHPDGTVHSTVPDDPEDHVQTSDQELRDSDEASGTRAEAVSEEPAGADGDGTPAGTSDADDVPGEYWGGNYAAPGASVGMQARDVTITGGLGIFMSRRNASPEPTGEKPGPEPEPPPGANVASGNDRVAFQVGRIHRRNP